ncbi:MAG: hemerythrin domain-containing protein [Armatimonadota bacterium]
MYATQQLRDEHEGIKTVLTVLEHLAGEMRLGRSVHAGHLEQIIDFLRTFADACHHGKEEEHLFPALNAAGLPSEGGPVGVMLHEHTLGRGHIRGMADALERLQAGEDAGDDFARHAQAYVDLLRAHIDKENDILFTMAENILPPPVQARLAERFETIERERIGPGEHERYHELIHSLRETYLQKAA